MPGHSIEEVIFRRQTDKNLPDSALKSTLTLNC